MTTGKGSGPPLPITCSRKWSLCCLPNHLLPTQAPGWGDVTRGRDQAGAEIKTNPLRVAQLRVWERESFWKRLGVEGGQREPGEQKAKEEG